MKTFSMQNHKQPILHEFQEILNPFTDVCMSLDSSPKLFHNCAKA